MYIRRGLCVFLIMAALISSAQAQNDDNAWYFEQRVAFCYGFFTEIIKDTKSMQLIGACLQESQKSRNKLNPACYLALEFWSQQTQLFRYLFTGTPDRGATEADQAAQLSGGFLADKTFFDKQNNTNNVSSSDVQKIQNCQIIIKELPY